MAKGSRGGKRVGGGAILGATGGGASSVSIADIIQNSDSTVVNFTSLTGDEQADAILNGVKDDVPDFLSDTAFQRFMYNNNLDGKPEIVDDATLDSMAGQDLFRTVNAVYDKYNDVGYSGKEIAEQLQYGDFTRFSDTGGSAYGKGLYFSNDYYGSASYGNTRNNIKKTAMVRCKLNSNAKIISYDNARTMYRQELHSGTNLAKACVQACNGDTKSAISIFALSKGYNVLTSSSNINASDTYFNILDRSVLTMSSDVKATGSKWK